MSYALPSRFDWTDRILPSLVAPTILRVAACIVGIPCALYGLAVTIGVLSQPPGDNSDIPRIGISIAGVIAAIVLAGVASWLDGLPVKPQIRRGFEAVLKRKPRR
jgi:hypothetical protein